jgi:mRNA-degrading endonuclease toxin of MazEF toxin-antitoxin module
MRRAVVVTGPGLEVDSVAQCHLCAVISVERIVDSDYGNVGAVELTQIRAVLGDLLDIG